MEAQQPHKATTSGCGTDSLRCAALCTMHSASCIMHPACDISALRLGGRLVRKSRVTTSAIAKGFDPDNNNCVVFSYFPSGFAEFYDAQLCIKQPIDLRNFNADHTNRVPARTPLSTYPQTLGSYIIVGQSGLISFPFQLFRIGTEKQLYTHLPGPLLLRSR